MFLKTLTNLFQTTSAHRKASAKTNRRRKEWRLKERIMRLEKLESRELMAVVSSGSSEITKVESQSTTTSPAPPAAPTFTVTAVSASQINLAWGSVSGASKYLVDEMVNGAWKQIASDGSSTLTTKVTGLKEDTDYSFQVAASSTTGTTWAASQSATTLLNPPAAPSVTATAVSASQINLSWKSVSYASGYLVNEQIGGLWTQIGSFGSGTTSDPVTGLNADTKFKFEVAAINSAGTTWSFSQSATTFLAPPAAPTFTVTAVSASQINLSWGSVFSASKYLVDEWVNGAWKQIDSDGSSTTTAKVTGLTEDTAYAFQVAAANSAGTTWAPSQSATTLLNPPAAPSVTATAISASQINLSWKSVSYASGYLVNEQIGGIWTQIGSFGSSTTSDPVTGLNASTKYQFEVAAVNSAGTTWSSSQSATTFLGAPAAPSYVVTVVSASQINLTWSTVPGASGYLVNEWINGAWQQIGSFGSSTTSDDVTGLSADTTYQFEVAAVNSAGTTWATSQSATTDAAATVDHPLAATAYTPASGSLFGPNGPLFTDVHQGQEGDCWLLVSLAEVAARDPNNIRSMFTAAGTTVENGTTVNLYTVRFYNSAGVAENVTVDTELPSGGEYYDQPVNGVLWVALAEKAYAQANGMGFVTTQFADTDSYDSLNGGSPMWSLQAITGQSASFFSINPNNIAAAWNAGELVVLDSSASANDNLIVGDSQGTHAYAMVNYAASSSSPFELYNPWGASSTVGGTISYNGHQVYGGEFYASATLLEQEFDETDLGAGAAGTKELVDSAPQATRPLFGVAISGVDVAISYVTLTGRTTGITNTSHALRGSASASTIDELFAKWNANEYRPEISLPPHG